VHGAPAGSEDIAAVSNVRPQAETPSAEAIIPTTNKIRSVCFILSSIETHPDKRTIPSQIENPGDCQELLPAARFVG
jgi:hypothetical protein